MLSFKTKFGRKVWKHIKEEHTIWFTTLGPDGMPHPRPVWFVWDRDGFLIYSKPEAFKVEHVRRHKKVALNFNTDPSGDTDVVVILGEAHIDKSAPAPDKMRAYIKKYAPMIPGINMTNEEYSAAYSTAIRIKPTAMRGW